MKQPKKYNIKLAGLCETGIYDSGVKQTNDYTMIYSGLPSVQGTRTAHGVVVCLDKEASRVWKQSDAEWETVNERSIRIRMNFTPVNVNIVVVYAPVSSTNTTKSDISENFYSDLQKTVGRYAHPYGRF